MKRKITTFILAVAGFVLLVTFQNFDYVTSADLVVPAKITWVNHIGSYNNQSHIVLYGTNFSPNNLEVELHGLGCNAKYKSPLAVEQANQIHFTIPATSFNRNCQVTVSSNGKPTKWEGNLVVQGTSP